MERVQHTFHMLDVFNSRNRTKSVCFLVEKVDKASYLSSQSSVTVNPLVNDCAVTTTTAVVPDVAPAAAVVDEAEEQGNDLSSPVRVD